MPSRMLGIDNGALFAIVSFMLYAWITRRKQVERQAPFIADKPMTITGVQYELPWGNLGRQHSHEAVRVVRQPYDWEERGDA